MVSSTRRQGRPLAIRVALTLTLIAAVVLAGTAQDAANAAVPSSGAGAGSILDQFKSPTASAKPMVRAWWPDAGSGASAAGLAMTAQHVHDMAAGGYGGMEIAYLSDQVTSIPQSSTLPPSQQLGQPGVDQNSAPGPWVSGGAYLDYASDNFLTFWPRPPELKGS